MCGRARRLVFFVSLRARALRPSPSLSLPTRNARASPTPNINTPRKPRTHNTTHQTLKVKRLTAENRLPHLLLYGPPGTGKTSTIKAIANEGRRHIINIQLSEIKTKQQLQHLFFNDEIHVYNGTNLERYTIPVSERLYVIEDIDAMGDAVLKREWKKPVAVKKDDLEPFMHKEEEKDALDLSFLLNLLDGTLEANGRILIITTNFPERIDRALIRPGRIDMIVHFQKCTLAVLNEMVNSFYDKQVVLEDTNLDGKWTPAEVNQILFRNFEDPDAGIKELVELATKDLYGFQDSA